MLVHILGWVVLLFQPRWVFMFAFACAILFFSLPIVGAPNVEPIAAVVVIFINVAIFVVVAGPIVAIRKWLASRKTKTDNDVDAELARIRAEAAAREAQQPPTS